LKKALCALGLKGGVVQLNGKNTVHYFKQ